MMRECTGDNVRTLEGTGSATRGGALALAGMDLEKYEDDITEIVHVRLFHDPESGLWHTVLYVS